MSKILLVEDERNFGHVLKDYLRMNQHEVHWSENGEQGLSAFREQQFDICILDVMMPRKDGFTLSAEIRAINKTIPFIFLTARGMKEDMIRGYKAGADDYIVKPFDSELLLLKINAILNRRNTEDLSDQYLYEIGKLKFNAKLRSLAAPEVEAIKLSPKESALLKLLCDHSSDVLPRDKALKLIWKEDNYFTGRSMDVYIVKLRKYLGNEAEILNIHGNGYALKKPEARSPKPGGTPF